MEESPPSLNRFNCSLRNAPSSIHNARNLLLTHTGKGMPFSLSYPFVNSVLKSWYLKIEPLLGASFELSTSLAFNSGACCFTKVQ